VNRKLKWRSRPVFFDPITPDRIHNAMESALLVDLGVYEKCDSAIPQSKWFRMGARTASGAIRVFHWGKYPLVM